MISIQGVYYDGNSSRKIDSEITFDDFGNMRLSNRSSNNRFSSNKTLRAEPVPALANFSVVQVSSRVGNTPRYLSFPGGAKFETHDNDSVDDAIKQFGLKDKLRFIHILESHKRYVLVTLIIVVMSSVYLVKEGIPALAKGAAFSLPVSTNSAIATGSLAALDKTFFSASDLAEETKKRLTMRFNQVVSASTLQEHDQYDFNLLFRKGNSLGANALALPSGEIVVTDEMVALAENDDELRAVFAHEIGHVIYRHGLRRVIQGSVVALLIVAVTGDAFSSSSLAASFPILLVELQYSQAFEREADQYSYDYLIENNIKTSHFSNLMARLQDKKANVDGDKKSIRNFFSTHPSTNERMTKFGGVSAGISH